MLGLDVVLGSKGVDTCPLCGSKAEVRVANATALNIQCTLNECGIKTPDIEIPWYTNKRGIKMWSRVRQRALKIWNTRTRRIAVNESLTPRKTCGIMFSQ